nr:anaerobic ribonucleoside-triphosphate reductase activating protein [Actinomycetales bacterium]
MGTTAEAHIGGPAAAAEDLQIAGLVPLSTVDWPGRLSAVVFTQGCPWDCGYCQNAALIDCELPGIVDWAGVVDLLGRRHGLLDAVVFSGGEATRQNSLGPAMAEVREMGFEVALHTAGAYPRRLAEVLPLVDWVGLDIKALPED